MERAPDSKSVSLWMSKDLIKRLDAIADATGLTRSRLLLNIVTVGVEEVEAMDKLGLLKAAKLVQELREKFTVKIAGVSQTA